MIGIKMYFGPVHLSAISSKPTNLIIDELNKSFKNLGIDCKTVILQNFFKNKIKKYIPKKIIFFDIFFRNYQLKTQISLRL